MGLSVVLLSGTAMSPANAENPFGVLEGLGQPVADQELGDVRGKFIQADRVSFFGISMVTSWQDHNGVTTTARLVFDVSFLNGSGDNPQPRLMVGWSREGDPAMDVTDSHTSYVPIIVASEVLPVGSLSEMKGAAQANIIAGADNRATNGLQIALVPSSQLAPFGSEGLTNITESASQTFSDGDTLQFRVETNELALALTGNHGTDSTLQSVGGDFGSVLQQTILGSHGNAVANSASIIIGTDFASSDFNAVRATEALSVMKGHGF